MAVSGINSMMNSDYSAANTSNLLAVSGIYDDNAAQANTKSLLDQYKADHATTTTPKKDTATFFTP